MNTTNKLHSNLVGKEIYFPATPEILEAIREEVISNLTPNKQYAIVSERKANYTRRAKLIELIDDAGTKISTILGGDTAHLAFIARWELVQEAQPVANLEEVIKLFDSVEDFNDWYLETASNIK